MSKYACDCKLVKYPFALKLELVALIVLYRQIGHMSTIEKGRRHNANHLVHPQDVMGDIMALFKFGPLPV